MRIEIDTKHDTKEEIKHVAAMLQALSASEGNSQSYPQTGMSRLDRKIAKAKAKNAPLDVFAPEPVQSSTSNSGFMNIFGEDPKPTMPASETVQSAESSHTGDIFSIFGSEPAQQSMQSTATQSQSMTEPIMPRTSDTAQPAQTQSESMDIFNMLNGGREGTVKEESEVEQDVRLVPY